MVEARDGSAGNAGDCSGAGVDFDAVCATVSDIDVASVVDGQAARIV